MLKTTEDYITEFINRWHINEKRAFRGHLIIVHGLKWKEEFKQKWEQINGNGSAES